MERLEIRNMPLPREKSTLEFGNLNIRFRKRGAYL